MPVITLLGDNPLSHTVNTSFVEPGFVTIDDDGEMYITEDVEWVGVVDLGTPGNCTITCSVDGSGEDSSFSIYRIVNVANAAAYILLSSLEASIYLLPAADDDGYPLSLYAGSTNSAVIRDVLSVRSGEAILVSVGAVEIKNATQTIFGPSDFNIEDDFYLVSTPHSISVNSGDSLTLVVDIENAEGSEGHLEIPIDVVARAEWWKSPANTAFDAEQYITMFVLINLNTTLAIR